MNKDALLATAIGFVVGLFITGMLLVGPKLSAFLPKITLPSFSLPQSKTPETANQPTANTPSFAIDSPLPDSIESEPTILVSGTATAGATIIIQTDSDDEVVLAKEDGKYAGKIALAEGKNDITVTGYSKGAQETRSVTVFYTPEEF